MNLLLKNISEIKSRANVLRLSEAVSALGILNALLTGSREDVPYTYLKNIGLFKTCSLFLSINHVHFPKPQPYLMAMERLKTSLSDDIAIQARY